MSPCSFNSNSVFKTPGWLCCLMKQRWSLFLKHSLAVSFFNSSWFSTGCQDHSMWKRLSFQLMVLGELDIHKQKNEVEPLSNSIYTKTVTQIRD